MNIKMKMEMNIHEKNIDMEIDTDKDMDMDMDMDRDKDIDTDRDMEVFYINNLFAQNGKKKTHTRHKRDPKKGVKRRMRLAIIHKTVNVVTSSGQIGRELKRE
jgi:hypothetical protein